MSEEITCTEYLGAVEPEAINYVMYSKKAIEGITRRAHFVAVAIGYDWSPDGRYPSGVWGLVMP